MLLGQACGLEDLVQLSSIDLPLLKTYQLNSGISLLAGRRVSLQSLSKIRRQCQQTLTRSSFLRSGDLSFLTRCSQSARILGLHTGRDIDTVKLPAGRFSRSAQFVLSARAHAPLGRVVAGCPSLRGTGEHILGRLNVTKSRMLCPTSFLGLLQHVYQELNDPCRGKPSFHSSLPSVTLFDDSTIRIEIEQFQCTKSNKRSACLWLRKRLGKLH